MTKKEKKLVCDLASVLTSLQDVENCSVCSQIIVSATYALWKFYNGDLVRFKSEIDLLNSLKENL